MQRKPLIAGNWKCFKTLSEAMLLVRKVRKGCVSSVDILVAPPFTVLYAVSRELQGSPIEVAGQNVHWEAQGAWTGEISAEQLLDAGCKYAIVGHSERRQYFGETPGTVNNRLHRCFETDLIPILCIGESLKERESGQAKDRILRDLGHCLKGLTAFCVSRMIVAYEPVWAIGTGLTATPEIAQKAHFWIRDWFNGKYSSEISNGLRILYGGSVNPDNIADLMKQPDIDGVLVGGASLDAKSFLKIIHYES